MDFRSVFTASGIFSVQSGSFTFLLRYRLHVPDPIDDESFGIFSFCDYVIPWTIYKYRLFRNAMFCRLSFIFYHAQPVFAQCSEAIRRTVPDSFACRHSGTAFWLPGFTIKVLLSRLLCADRTLVSEPVLLPVFLDISRILRYNLLYNKCRNGSDTHLFSLMTVLLLGRFAAAKMPFLFILLQYFFHLFVKRWIHAVEMFRHIFMYRTFADPEFCSRAPYCRPIFHKIGSEDNTTFLAAGNIHQSRSLLSVSENCMLPKRRTDLF